MQESKTVRTWFNLTPAVHNGLKRVTKQLKRDDISSLVDGLLREKLGLPPRGK